MGFKFRLLSVHGGEPALWSCSGTRVDAPGGSSESAQEPGRVECCRRGPPQAGDSASKCMFCLFIIVFQNRVSVCRLKQASFELKILLL